MGNEPKVTLLSYTQNPVALLYAVEKLAKSNSSNPYLVDVKTIQNVLSIAASYNLVLDYNGKQLFQGDKEQIENDPQFQELGHVDIFAYEKEVRNWVAKVVTMAIPIAEFVNFSFLFENVTIAFREQLVRHRTNSFWVQSGRSASNYGTFAKEGRFHIPENIKKYPELANDFKHLMFQQSEFVGLARYYDIPDEDSREVVGVGVLHRLSMQCNLRSLIELLKHRTCHISQAEHWTPIVMSIVEELKKVDPLFANMGKPPCYENGVFTHCKYEGIATERYGKFDENGVYSSKDKGPICPLFHASLSKENKLDLKLVPTGKVNKDLNAKFSKLWNWDNKKGE